MNMDINTRTGTLGGIVIVLLFKIRASEVFSTIVLAAIGAIVSFAVSYCCEKVKRKFRK